MLETVLRPSPADEYYTDERCFVLEASNIPEDPEVSIARARVEPGVVTRWHRLAGVTERYYILSGRGRAEIGNLPPRDVVPGDVLLIPPLVRQRIANTGTDDLVFLCVCSPRFLPEAYEDIEEEAAQSLDFRG